MKLERCFYSLLTMLTLARACRRQSSRVRDENKNDSLQALTRQISHLNLHNLTGQVTTTSSDSNISQTHIAARNQEVDRISGSIGNDVLAFGFKNAAQAAFNNSCDPLETRVICTNSSAEYDQSIQSIHPRPRWSFRRVVSMDNKVVETFFGTFRMSCRTTLLSPNPIEGPTSAQEKDLCERDTVFRLTPALWLVRLGFVYGISGRISQSPLVGS